MLSRGSESPVRHGIHLPTVPKSLGRVAEVSASTLSSVLCLTSRSALSRKDKSCQSNRLALVYQNRLLFSYLTLVWPSSAYKFWSFCLVSCGWPVVRAPTTFYLDRIIARVSISSNALLIIVVCRTYLYRNKRWLPDCFLTNRGFLLPLNLLVADHCSYPLIALVVEWLAHHFLVS